MLHMLGDPPPSGDIVAVGLQFKQSWRTNEFDFPHGFSFVFFGLLGVSVCPNVAACTKARCRDGTKDGCHGTEENARWLPQQSRSDVRQAVPLVQCVKNERPPPLAAFFFSELTPLRSRIARRTAAGTLAAHVPDVRSACAPRAQRRWRY